jgi:hypothetical protein
MRTLDGENCGVQKGTQTSAMRSGRNAGKRDVTYAAHFGDNRKEGAEVAARLFGIYKPNSQVMSITHTRLWTVLPHTVF